MPLAGFVAEIVWIKLKAFAFIESLQVTERNEKFPSPWGGCFFPCSLLPKPCNINRHFFSGKKNYTSGIRPFPITVSTRITTRITRGFQPKPFICPLFTGPGGHPTISTWIVSLAFWCWRLASCAAPFQGCFLLSFQGGWDIFSEKKHVLFLFSHFKKLPLWSHNLLPQMYVASSKKVKLLIILLKSLNLAEAKSWTKSRQPVAICTFLRNFNFKWSRQIDVDQSSNACDIVAILVKHHPNPSLKLDPSRFCLFLTRNHICRTYIFLFRKFWSL